MMSDSDNDDLLLLERPFQQQQQATRKSSVHDNAADDDDDDDLRRTLEASQATFAAEENRRKSIDKYHKGVDADSEDDDASELLVVKRKKSAVPAVKSETSKSASSRDQLERKQPPKQPLQQPFLTATGERKVDPYELQEDEDEDLDVIDIPLLQRIKAKSKHAASKPKTSVTVDCDADESDVEDEDDEALLHSTGLAKNFVSDNSRDTHSSPSEASPPAAAQKAFDGDSSSSSDSQEDKPSWKRQSKKLAKSSPEDVSSDSDDESCPTNTLRNKKEGQPRAKAAASKTSKKKASPKSVKAEPARKAAAEEKRRLKEAQKKEREELRRLEHEKKEAAKQLEKEKRQQAKVAKQAALEAEKQGKKRHREVAAQHAGKYSSKEIAVLVESGLFQHEFLTVADDLKEVGYLVQEYPSGLGCNALQWIRKDHLAGGADDAVKMLLSGQKDGYEHLHTMAVIADPLDFIDKLNESDNDYPQLKTWLFGIEAGWRKAWRYPEEKRPRLIVILNKVKDKLHELWASYRARKNGGPPPAHEELEDAIVWMQIQFQVEVVCCDSLENMSKDALKMTRMLAEKPYQRRVTELECVKKLKAQCMDTEPPDVRAKDCWIRQLQQIPRVSEKLATHFADYYPSARSLWLAYQDDSMTEVQKEHLAAGLFSSTQRHNKISSVLYQVMTSSDPDELLK